MEVRTVFPEVFQGHEQTILDRQFVGPAATSFFGLVSGIENADHSVERATLDAGETFKLLATEMDELVMF